jgi:hypothetical protein
LINKCKNLTEYDYSITFYRIEKKYWDNQKKLLSSLNIPVSKTGAYYLTDNDNIILSTKPKSWSNYCVKNVGNCDDWGYRSRMVVKIRNKKFFDIRGIKTESDATSETYRIIKDVWNIFRDTQEYKDGINHKISYTSKKKYIDVDNITKIMLNKTIKKTKLKPKHKPKPKPPISPSPSKKQDGYIYCIFDNTRPGLVKLGKSEKDVSIEKERISSGYAKRYFPLGTKCIKRIQVSNPTLAEKLLFEQCKNERIEDTEWFFIEKINKRIKEGLFEGIKNSIDKKI